MDGVFEKSRMDVALFRERYWFVSLLVLILGLGVAIWLSTWGYMSSVLGACTLYVMVRGQLKWLTEKRKVGRMTASLLLLAEVTVFFLIPIVVIIFLLVNKLQSADLDLSLLVKEIEKYTFIIKDKTGYDLLSKDNMAELSSLTAQVVQGLLGGVSNILINLMLMVFVLFFMLWRHSEMETYVAGLLPFKDENKVMVLRETRNIINSNALGIPLLAIIQGILAYVGYVIFGIGEPVFYAVLTCFATIIPIVGTTIIWIPLCVYLFVTKDWGNGVGLLLYSGLLITNVDNLVRLLIQKKMGNIHPLITVFGVIMGLPLFGFWGIIFGPLMLALFCLFVDVFKREYIDPVKRKPVAEAEAEASAAGSESE